MTTPFINHGGHGAEWEDLLNCVAKVVRRMYPSLDSTEFIDDALQDTMVRMLEYWQFLPSSYIGEQLDFRLALFYGIRYCRTRLGEMVEGQLQRGGTDIDSSYDDDIGHLAQMSPPVYEYEATTEDAEEEALFLLLSDAPDDDLREWFESTASGETQIQEAIRKGVSQPTVSRHRAAQRKRARDRADWLGLARA